MNTTDPLRNPKDPLHHATQPAARELFKQIGALCNGFSNDQVLDAALNLAINALRQTHGTWPKSEAAFNEFFGRAKQNLREQYDSVTGRKKGIYPYDQSIEVPLVKFRKTG